MLLGNFTHALAFFHGLKERAHNTLHALASPIDPTSNQTAPLALVYPLWATQDTQDPHMWHLRVHGVVLTPRDRNNPPRWWQKASFGFVGQLWGHDREREERLKDRMRIAFAIETRTTVDAIGIDGIGPGEVVRDEDGHIATMVDKRSPKGEEMKKMRTSTVDGEDDDDAEDIRWFSIYRDPPMRSSVDGVFDLTGLAETTVTLPARFKPGTPLSFAVRINGTTNAHRSTLQLIGREGFSIISDVDDTVKDTRVLSKREALKRTLVEEYTPIPGMPELFKHLEKSLSVQQPAEEMVVDGKPHFGTKVKDFFDKINIFKKQTATPSPTVSDVQFHFLSASSFDLLPPLSGFVRDYFPATSSLLPSPKRVQNLGGQLILDLRNYKSNGTRWIARQFPERKFLLFGDSGQFDPEGYGDVAREEQSALRRRSSIPDEAPFDPSKTPSWLQDRQYRCVLIRLVQGQDAQAEAEKNAEPRFRSAFANVHPSTWRIFSDPKELMRAPFHTGSCYGHGEKNVWWEKIRRWEVLQEQLRQEAEARRIEAEDAKRRAQEAREQWKLARKQSKEALKMAEEVKRRVPSRRLDDDDDME